MQNPLPPQRNRPGLATTIARAFAAFGKSLGLAARYAASRHYLMFLGLIVTANWLLDRVFDHFHFNDRNGFVGNFFTIAFGAMYFRPGSHPARPLASLIQLTLAALLANLVNYASIYAIYMIKLYGITMTHAPQVLELLPATRDISYTALSEAMGGGPVRFLIMACLSAPLWEELIRGLVYKAAHPWMAPGMAFGLALLPSLLTHVRLPCFTIGFHMAMGYLLMWNYSWLERAVIHSLCNLLSIANLLWLGLLAVDVDFHLSLPRFLSAVAALVFSCIALAHLARRKPFRKIMI